MAIAAFHGTVVGYTDYYNSVLIEKLDGRVMVMNPEVFNYLYIKLDNFNAALKEDCIEYHHNSFKGSLEDQPTWYVELYEDKTIYPCPGYEETLIFVDDSGEYIMIEDSVILRNFQGEVRYMTYSDFLKFYDVSEEVL